MLFNLKKKVMLHVGQQDTGYVYAMETRDGTHAIEKVANEKDFIIL